jgi:NAD-dependent SIR2 family protein deacetylase
MHSPELARFIRDHPRLFVLTGAGISTPSGIPGYRDVDGNWRRKPPVTHQEFVRSESARKRYWARSLAGWPAIQDATPNAAHGALASLERIGHVTQLVTQNVDGLHQRAGSTDVIDLHGRLDRVVCLDCGGVVPRSWVQTAMQGANPSFPNRADQLAPDGDADLTIDCSDFDVPECPRCRGLLKPDVVFFGDADAVLIVGSSLMAYSGYRFCERARQDGKPIAAVNRGRTRADPLYALKIDGDCVPALSTLVTSLAHGPGAVPH